MGIRTRGVVAAVIVMAVLGAGCSDDGETAAEPDDPGRTLDRSEKAMELCEGFMTEIADLQPRLGVVSDSSVGEIRQVLADLDKDPIPEWADLSDADFIAICGYPLGETSALRPPTTTCPDGEAYSLAEPSQARYLVAESGLGVEDVTQDDLPPSVPVGCP